VLDELTGSTVTRTYTYGLQRISENQLVSGTWTPSFYGYDGGGNVRQLMNSAGVTTDSYEYDAFGNKISSTGTTPNNYLYRGEQYDPDLGLYYLRARYYNPATGRFMSRDPEVGHSWDPKSLHKYLYAGGDPVNAADPSGRGALQEYGLSLAIVATVAAQTIDPVKASGAALCFGVFVSRLLNAVATDLNILTRNRFELPEIGEGLSQFLDGIQDWCEVIE
jgi:RHS repeat-associated protein